MGLRANWLVWAALACVGLGGCARLPVPEVPEVPEMPKEACSGVAKAGQPSLCMLRTGETYVVGLPAAHGWQRGIWVQLSVDKPGLTERWPAALAVVAEAWSDVAKVAVLYQREVKLDGAQARTIARDERARLGKFVGRVIRLEGRRVQIDVGSADGVVPGEVYSLRKGEQDEESVGRLRLTAVENLAAWGELVDYRAAVAIGQTAVYSQGVAETESKAGKRIVVVNFHPLDTDSQTAGRTFANQFAIELGNAAVDMGVDVRYEQTERVDWVGSERSAHEQARQIGKRLGADIVIWGAMQCSKRACVEPRFTVVEPEGFRAMRAGEVWLDRTDAGVRLKAGEVDGLASVVLGTLAFKAQRYGDASHYLGRAIVRNVLIGEDMFSVFEMLTYSQYMQGQSAAARSTAVNYREQALKAGLQRWEMSARGELARLERREGRAQEARDHLIAIRTWSEGVASYKDLGNAVFILADLDKDAGRVDDARKGYEFARATWGRIGDAQGEATTLHAIADLDLLLGRFEAARNGYSVSLEINSRLANARGEANSRQSMAHLDEMQGREEDARKGYQASLTIRKRVGDVAGEAASLNMIAQLDMNRGRAVEARQAFEASAAISRRIGDLLGEANARFNLAYLDSRQDRISDAYKGIDACLEMYRRAGYSAGEAKALQFMAWLDVKWGHTEDASRRFLAARDIQRRLGDISSEADTLRGLAEVDIAQGRVQDARSKLTASITVHRKLGVPLGEALALYTLASLDMHEGHLDKARTSYETALAIYIRINCQPGRVTALEALANLDFYQGRITEARRGYESSLAIARQIESAWHEAYATYGIAYLDAQQGLTEKARRGYESSLAIAQHLGDTWLEELVEQGLSKLVTDQGK